jgi:hypothetical protein
MSRDQPARRLEPGQCFHQNAIIATTGRVNPRQRTQDQERWFRASHTGAKEDPYREDEQQAGKAHAWLAGEPIWLRGLLGRGSGGSYPTGDDLEWPGAGRLSPLPQIERRLVVEFVGVVWERFMDRLLGRGPPVPFSIYVYCWY